MGGAWLLAGAQAVVLSDQDLQVDPTLALSKSLVAALLEAGESPAAALQQARRKLLEDQGEVALFETRGLHVLGLGHLPLTEKDSSPPGLSPGPVADPEGWSVGWMATLTLLAVAAVVVLGGLSRSSSK
jgi:hypothetical protein